MTPGRQLALPFPHAPHYRADDFCAAPSNAAALAWMDRTASWPGGRLALWGEAGSGKTHLLHLWAAARGATLIEGPALRALPPLPARGIALDDADACPDEETLLHLLNAAAEARLPLLLAGRAPPARWPVRLPDLSSRLRATTAVALGAAEETLLRTLLARLLAERQLAVPEALQDWLLLRLPRRPAAIREAAARLDRAALATGGRVTRTVAASVLASLDSGTDDGTDDGEADDVLASPETAGSPFDLPLF